MQFKETDMPYEKEWRRYFRPKLTLSKIFGLKGGDVFVDLGCGYGTFSIPGAEIVGSSGLVYAVDIDRKMVKRVLKKAKGRKLQNVRAIASDISSIGNNKSIPDSCADVLLLANVIHGARNKSGQLKSLGRILKRRGKIVVMNWVADRKTPRGPPNRMRPTEEDTVAFLEKAGFSSLKVVEVPPYHYAVIARIR